MLDTLSPPIAILFLIAGIALTVIGAETLIRGAARIARRLGLTPFVIGLTVVAFGTSAPEMFASVKASLDGKGELGVGNVLGSNIANIALVLPIAAIIAPIATNRSLLKRDLPILIAITITATLLMLDRSISRYDGLILFAGAVVYTIYNYRKGISDPELIGVTLETEHEHGLNLERNVRPKLLLNLVLTIIGLCALSTGAAMLVKGGVDLARAAEVPEIVIGATIVAFGTSVPELATSIQAARKKQTDIAVGNIVGSNVFNVFAVLGAASIAKPIPVSNPTRYFHIPAVILITILFVPIITFGTRLGRARAAFLLLLYIAYASLSYLLDINS